MVSTGYHVFRYKGRFWARMGGSVGRRKERKNGRGCKEEKQGKKEIAEAELGVTHWGVV
jgi:hypothetical protein